MQIADITADFEKYCNNIIPRLAVTEIDGYKDIIKQSRMVSIEYDDALLKKAQIKMKQGDFAAADTLLGTLVIDFPSDVLADLALMTRGRLNEDHLGNKEKAMQYYEELITRYPGSIYSVDARKRFRNLRGDKGF